MEDAELERDVDLAVRLLDDRRAMEMREELRRIDSMRRVSGLVHCLKASL